MIKRILNILKDTESSKRGYIIKAYLISFIPTFLLLLLSTPFIPDSELHVEMPLTLGLLNFLLISPWIETLVMWLLLWALSVFTENVFILSVISGVAWGIIHGLILPIWGLFAFWPFVVLSICFLEWKKKSVKKAVIITSLVHTCHNIFPSFCLVINYYMESVP
ncbi:hypothetical protein K8T06_15820 [bacterium]|nr:hypothetical protein [bacterium]